MSVVVYSHVPTINYRKNSYSDFFLLILFLVFLHYFIGLAKQWNGDFHPEAAIDLSLTALPKYSFFSLIRAFVAYVLSLLFTLVYGYIAAKNKTSERLMIPLLDIGQSIPVLGFMPGLVLGLISIFPKSNFGMELACILLIFTGQVWNMTFAFYASVRSVPAEFYELSDIVGLNWWQKFKQIELPFSAINLAWNSLMSMAGGWFFLIACESFTLGEKNFRLPGLGSYMAVAAEKNDARAATAGIIAMCLVILFTDFLVWRPIIAWTRKFRLEQEQDEIEDTPYLTMLLKESRIILAVDTLLEWLKRPNTKKQIQSLTPKITIKPIFKKAPKYKKRKKKKFIPLLKKILPKLIIILTIALLFWVFIRLWEFIRVLHLSDWRMILSGTFFTLLRVVMALLLGSLWAIPFGIWVGLSQKLTRFFQPIIQLLASFPAPMLYPLALALFSRLHIGLAISSTFLILLGVQWYIVFNVLAGAIGISREVRENFNLVGVEKKFLWKTLYLPSVFPALITGWITAAGGAWNASIVAEYILYAGRTIKTPGLGSLISEATAAGNYPLLLGCLIVMVAVVVGINRSFWRPIQHFAEIRYKFER